MKSCKLSGADYFLLALDKHIKQQSGPGFVCRFVMEFEGLLSKSDLREAVERSIYFKTLRKVYLSNPDVGIARWKMGKESRPIPIRVGEQSEDSLPDDLLQSNIDLKAESLFAFDLIHIGEIKTILVFSWHHLLMDGYGVNKLLASLNDDSCFDLKDFFPQEEKEGLWKQWKQLVFTKDYLRVISKKPLLQIEADYSKPRIGYLLDQLTEEEYRQVKENSRLHNQGLVHTPYYLTSAALAFDKVAAQKNLGNKDIFVPVPMEMRKANATGPVLTNQHSMLFFRIPRDLMQQKAKLVKEVNRQLFEQVKLRVPQQYATMSRMLRHIPLWFYYLLIKRPNGDSIAAFPFSQSPSPDNLKDLLGLKLLNATALPPSTAPPGISFQIMTFGQKLNLVLQYSESCFTKEEAQQMLDGFKDQLLGVNE